MFTSNDDNVGSLSVSTCVETSGMDLTPVVIIVGLWTLIPTDVKFIDCSSLDKNSCQGSSVRREQTSQFGACLLSLVQSQHCLSVPTRESHLSCTYRNNSCNLPSHNIMTSTPDLRHEQAHLHQCHFSKVFCGAILEFLRSCDNELSIGNDLWLHCGDLMSLTSVFVLRLVVWCEMKREGGCRYRRMWFDF